MKTHLQQAAKALLTSATEEEWYAGYAGLRKALDAELTQSVEPVAYRSKRESGSYTYCLTDQFFYNAEPLYLHPPQPQAMTRALVTQLVEPDKQRADLVTQLRACLSGPATLTTQEANAIEEAANTLEEYARKIESLECAYTDQVLRAHAAEKVSMTKLHQIELQAQLARKEAYILELEAKLNED